MTQPLDYARPPASQRLWTLALPANATAAYPLFVLASLYGEWLLAWCVLGHQPQPSLDDPKSISGSSWMHVITYLAISGLVPAAFAAIILNPWYLINARASSDHIVVRVGALIALWFGALALLWWDPGSVLYWWFD